MTWKKHCQKTQTRWKPPPFLDNYCSLSYTYNKFHLKLMNRLQSWRICFSMILLKCVQCVQCVVRDLLMKGDGRNLQRSASPSLSPRAWKLSYLVGTIQGIKPVLKDLGQWSSHCSTGDFSSCSILPLENCLSMINLHCLNMICLLLHQPQAPCFAMPFNTSVFSPSESSLFYRKKLHSCGRHTLFMHHGFLDL